MTATLPQYKIRVSPRAKHVRLRFTLDHGLVVVVPEQYDVKLIPALLRRNERWLAQAAQWVSAQQRCYAREAVPALPDCVELLALAETWPVEYREAEGNRIPVIEHNGRLLVFSGVSDAGAVRLALKSWLSRKARSRLVPWLIRLSRQHGFTVLGTAVKAQRSRWASCTAQQRINLNMKLLFLPPDLVTYTMIHELCHTIQLNHSERFWELVQHCDSDYLAKDHKLKSAWQYVPQWLELA